MTTLAIRVDNVAKSYRAAGGYFGRGDVTVHAVDGVSLSVRTGSTFGVVGQSGSGKSTLARLIAGLEAPDTGAIEICGMPAPPPRSRAWRALRRKMQVIFQDPYSSLDPLLTVGQSVAEPLINMTDMNTDARTDAVIEALAAVRLEARLYAAYPYQLSGGERQRVCIARALVQRPDVVICDEAVSALDVETQVQVVELLRELQASHRLSYLFISHDIAIVSQLCEEVAVMKDGKIVEFGSSRQVLEQPANPYTQSLVEAALYFQQGRRRS